LPFDNSQEIKRAFHGSRKNPLPPSIDGRVFVKTSPDGAPIRIFHEEDFEDM